MENQQLSEENLKEEIVQPRAAVVMTDVSELRAKSAYYDRNCDRIVNIVINPNLIMDTIRKLEILKDTYSDQAQLNQIVDKLLDIALSQHRQNLEKYQHDMREFEQRYGMESSIFYQHFQAGELGDDIDFFEWVALYELKQDLLKKIDKLEKAV